VNNLSTAYIGLGSNLNNPHLQIDSAVNTLRDTSNIDAVHCSYYYSSKAVGPGEQPDYVNAVVRCQTHLSPMALLAQLQLIENQHGRQRDIRWGARTLDLDLLLYDDICLEEATLQIPHPEISKRNFVLYPLFDLNPELVFPDGNTLRKMISAVPMTDLHRIDPNLRAANAKPAQNES
jgi:2-amino-4-hydroxy-6-hydroxymethyldihydropteridine diphosphokinase